MVLIWCSQCLSIMGFSFAFPFVPYFLQADLGITDHAALKMWVAIFSSSSAITMGIAAPFWGMLADRYGKRLMLIRANFAAAIIMSLMGAVQSPVALIALRFLQGGLTGTMTAAQTFLSGEMPKERRGMALGGLSAAVFSGMMLGAFLGSFVAHWLGYRAAFYCSGGLLATAGVLVLMCKRDVPPPRPVEGAARPHRRAHLTAAVWGVLALIGGISLVRQFDIAFMPLLVQDIHGSLDGVALRNGWLNACGSVAGLLAGLTTGWLADRWNPMRLIVFTALLAAVFSGLQGFAHSFLFLFPIRFLTVCCSGSLEPALNAWIAKNVPDARQGSAFGWASTMRSIGWTCGPLLAGAVAAVELRAVFFCAAVGFTLLSGFFALQNRRMRAAAL